MSEEALLAAARRQRARREAIQKRFADSAAERFWSNVHRGKPDECWPWLGNLADDGSGKFSVGGRIEATYHAAWILTNGPIPQDPDTGRSMVICHACDFRPCCNPAHLFLGTHTDNMRDKAKKERGRGQKNRCYHWSDPRMAWLRELRSQLKTPPPPSGGDGAERG